MILREVAGSVEALFIERAAREGDPWSGQVALPGGRFDASDADLLVTARRETREEVALDLDAHGVLLGQLDEHRPRTPALPPVIVRPFVFALATEPEALVASDEVAHAFWVPLAHLTDPARRSEVTIPVRGMRVRLPAIATHDRVIWGMTERILKTFLEVW